MAAMSAGSLPTGARGRLLAVLVTLALLAVLWLGVISPLLDSYAAGAEQLAQRQALAGRMQDLADALPSLREQLQKTRPKDMPATALLQGASDAVAAATLQSLLEAMCGPAGVKVTSSEALPAEQAGSYRRIGLRVSLDANWAQLIHLLRAVRTASPRMFVDDLQLHAQPTADKVRELPLDIALTVLAFRLPGASPAGPADTPPPSPDAPAAATPPAAFPPAAFPPAGTPAAALPPPGMPPAGTPPADGPQMDATPQAPAGPDASPALPATPPPGPR
jgi:Tfp pilus assembly protein PilO